MYGYCPRCHSHTSDMHDKTLCDTCKRNAETGDELIQKVNGLLNEYALTGKDSRLIEALQAENQRLKKENNP